VTKSGKIRLLLCCLALVSSSLQAWGQNGHKVVGALALDHLSTTARLNLTQLLGTSNIEDTIQWCIWPDAFRATDEGSWTAPMHFVVIATGSAGSHAAVHVFLLT